MNYSSSKFHSLVVASLLFSTVSLSAVSSNNLVNASSFIDHDQNQSSFAENEIIVTFKEGADVFDKSKDASSPLSVMSDMSEDYMAGFNSNFKNLLDAKLGKEKFTARGYRKLGAMHIKSDVNSTEELMAIFKADEMKEYVKSISKNNIMALSSSNDSYYSKLWAVENTGQEVNNKSGTDDADMDIVEAWNRTKGDKDVIVAVLDTGVDYTHDDLKENMWSGLTKHGLDFAGDNDGNNDDDPMPDKPYDEKGHYHGTHVAGTIGAVGDNEKGVSGVAQNVAIMALKVFRPNGSGYSSDIMEALDYIAERIDAGDNIVAINASYGGGGSQNDATNDAIKKLGEKGVVFCAAAGNDGKNIDDEPTYPASYDASNIIAVAASDQDDKLASFSNYGANSVDVAAPGTNILSTYPDNQYTYLQGTSMATPNVAGAVALLASQYPNSTVAERKAMILNNVDKKSAFDGKMTTGGRVNINDALEDEPKNTAPVAKDDSEKTAYETSVTIDVLANDSDEDGDTLTLKSVGEASNGKVEISDGKVVYTPNDKFEGSDSFEYTISDGTEETTAKVAVTVEEKPNTAPVAKDDSEKTAYETAVTIDVLANDSDEDNDTLTLKFVGDASNGKVEINNGKVVYTPDDKFEGSDSFEYTISDGTAETTAKVAVTVEEKPNSAPIAKDDSASTAYETAVTIDVLANDSDEDGDKLTLKSVGKASNGTVEVKDGKVVYTPNKEFEGDDHFEYTISDGEKEVNAKVTVTVNKKKKEPNNTPVAQDDKASTPYATTVTIDVLVNDSDEDNDTLNIESVGKAENGKVVIEDGKINYTPNDKFEGEDSFDYTISDGEEKTTAKVLVTVEAKPNSAPATEDDTASTAYQTAVTIDVLANDSDEDGDKLTLKSVGEASNGKVEVKDGKVVYTPNDKFEGEDSFEYTISDGELEKTAKVSVTVEEKPNSAPVSKDDTATTAYEQAISIDVLANDRDEDGNALSIKSVEKATNGVAEIKAGKILYTPNSGFEGKDSFNYTVTDGTLNSTSLVTVVVEENPNIAPVAQEDNATTAYETAVTIDVLANDSDENGDTLTLKSVGKASNGTVEIQDGKVNYKPNTGFEGSDNFEYTLSDGEAETTAKVTVTVEEKPNTAPVAKDDTATANHNESVTIEVLKNDSDENGDKLSIVSFTEASHGTVSQDDDNLVYTPNKDYSGDDSFAYTITDGELKATANVSIKVKEKSEEVQLPVFGRGFGMGQSSDEWKDVDFFDHDISFGTKDGTKVSMGLDKDNQLVGSIKVNGKESKLTINVPDTSMKIDSNGATLIEFKGKEMSITIGSDGTISPKLPTLKNAVLPKKALPLGTELTVSGDLMKFVLPLSDEIKF